MWARAKTFASDVLNLLLPGSFAAARSTLTDVLEKITKAVNETSNGGVDQLARLKPYIEKAKMLLDGSISFEKPVYFLNVCPAIVTRREPEHFYLDQPLSP